jgi:hypothetical protein
LTKACNVVHEVQEAMILMADTTNMGPEAKSWYATKRRQFMQEMERLQRRLPRPWVHR